jgi:hypothetical protein
MRLRTVAKDPGSGNGGCPSVHVDEDEDGFCVVQGNHVPNEQLPDFLPGEGGVRIDVDRLIEAMPELLASAARRAQARAAQVTA